MARIVSGVEQHQDPGMAFLAGHDRARVQRREDDAEARKSREVWLDFIEAQSKYQREEAKALARAQQGEKDARALAAVGDLQARAKAHPKLAAKMMRAKMAKGALTKLAERGVSEDTLQRIMGHVADAEKSIEAEEQRKAAMAQIEKSKLDKVPGSELYDARIAAGEQPHMLLREDSEQRIKRSTYATNEANAQEYITKAQALIQAAPPGRQRDFAMTLLNEFGASPSLQREEDSGPKILQSVQAALLGNQEQYDEAQRLAEERRMARFTTDPMPGLGGMSGNEMRDQLEREPTLGFGGPQIGGDASTIPGTHATVKSGKMRNPRMLRTVVAQLAEQTRSPRELREALEAQGVPLDSEALAVVRETLAARRSHAQAGAGADR